MRTSFLQRALQASILTSLITVAFAQTATMELSAITTLGCYSNVNPLVNNNTNTFQTSGKCQPVCANAGHPVMALTGGSTCYCGDELPALDKQVDETNCNSPCQGYDLETCGGIGYWQVFLTGLTGDVSTAPNATANSTSSSSSTSSSQSTSHQAQTIVVTASSTPKTTQSASAGPNKVGIAVGVVVGVIAIAAIAGGAVLYYKQKKRRELIEEHKAQAAVNSFVGARTSDTKSDNRLDPSMASYRRESIGSIADERDFSRKILMVRNPDRGSINSVA